MDAAPFPMKEREETFWGGFDVVGWHEEREVVEPEACGFELPVPEPIGMDNLIGGPNAGADDADGIL